MFVVICDLLTMASALPCCLLLLFLLCVVIDCSQTRPLTCRTRALSLLACGVRREDAIDCLFDVANPSGKDAPAATLGELWNAAKNEHVAIRSTADEVFGEVIGHTHIIEKDVLLRLPCVFFSTCKEVTEASLVCHVLRESPSLVAEILAPIVEQPSVQEVVNNPEETVDNTVETVEIIAAPIAEPIEELLSIPEPSDIPAPTPVAEESDV